MFDYTAEKRRRIQQFVQAFEPMHDRTVNVVKDCCFLRIEEHEDPMSTKLELEASQIVARVLTHGATDSLESNFDSTPDIEGWSDDGWRESEKSRRFVQYIFLEKHFEMDLPRPTLWPMEARQLIQRRTGFFFLGERGDADKQASVIRRFHPLRKAYVHGDHLSVAEDLAYIFFELWKFPVDARLYLSTWGGRNQWDSSRPLD